MKKVILTVCFLIVVPSKVEAALFINEFSSGTSDSDWVEIYNSDSSSVDLSSYILRDSTSSNKIELSGTINGNSYATFDWSDRLNNEGDTIRLLLKSDESTVDQIAYGSSASVPLPSSSQTGGRNPDGSSSWVLFNSATKGSTNNSTVFHTPTPTPTHTPTPQNTPTPTKTPTPTNAPTNTPTPTTKISTSPTVTPRITLRPTSNEATEEAMMMRTTAMNQPQQEVQGAQVDLGGKLDELDKKEGSNNWAKLLILMGAVIITGACGVFIYNNYQKEKIEEITNQ